LAEVADLAKRFCDAILPSALDVNDSDETRQSQANWGELDGVLNNAVRLWNVRTGKREQIVRP
jgi:NADP-dependent 3-hydroxy acid dehydrogenase YdfG